MKQIQKQIISFSALLPLVTVILIVIGGLLPTISLAQARLIIGNTTSVYAVMNSNAVRGGNPIYLVADNSATNAVTRNSGWIISEGENNMLKWNTAGASSGTYTVPWGYSTTTYIPLAVTLSAAGSPATGYINFSTYRTTWNNSTMLPLSGTNPPTSFYSAVCSCVADAYAIDRFWSIDASSYATTKPNLSDLSFTYVDGGAGNPEVLTTNNTITESNLQAQRWNSTANSWEAALFGSDNIGSNLVNTISITGNNDLYKWWTLVDNTHPLPVELIYFNATAENNTRVKCDWQTATEMNNDHFVLERSKDGITYEQLIQVPSAAAPSGNSNTPLNYVYYDEHPYTGVSYYQLKQVDHNGQITPLPIRSVYIGAIDIISIYPNPSYEGYIQYTVASEAGGDISVEVIDILGQEVINQQETIESGVVATKKLNTEVLSSGIYLLRITNSAKEKVQKQFLIK